jgi:hypothetical protein
MMHIFLICLLGYAGSKRRDPTDDHQDRGCKFRPAYDRWKLAERSAHTLLAWRRTSRNRKRWGSAGETMLD